MSMAILLGVYHKEQIRQSSCDMIGCQSGVEKVARAVHGQPHLKQERLIRHDGVSALRCVSVLDEPDAGLISREMRDSRRNQNGG